MLTNFIGLLLVVVMLVAWGGPIVGVYPEGYEASTPTSGLVSQDQESSEHVGPRIPTSHSDYTQEQKEATNDVVGDNSQNTVSPTIPEITSENESALVNESLVDEEVGVYVQRAEYYRCIGVCVDFHGESCDDCREQCKR